MADFDLASFIIALVAAFILVLINAFFVAAEFALVSVRPSRVEELIQKTGSRRAKAVKKAIENQDEVISATQLGITMASLALGFLAGSFIEPILELFFDEIGLVALFGGLALGGLLAYALTTYMHVVLGELAPKSIALQYPARTSMWIATPLHWFAILFKPVIWLFNQTGWLVLALFGIKPVVGHRGIHSEDELKLLISQSSKAGVLDEQETAILKKTFDLPDTQVRMIMTPRRDAVTVSISDDFTEIIRTVNKSGHSRLPVYDEEKERIFGFLYAKDLLQYLELAMEKDESFDAKEVNISELLRESDYVPETMRADRLLARFQEEKRHSAVVVDEYGEFVGIVTLEDILELLVGDIQDEYDLEPAEIIPSSDTDGVVVVNGQTTLDDFNEYFHTNFSSDISVTISGLIIEKLGRIPVKDESIKLQNISFTMDQVTESRVVSLLVQKIPSETESPDPSDQEESPVDDSK
ncbi:MAG: hemolysin family protein [Candidatus Odinarchaeota archaeon]